MTQPGMFTQGSVIVEVDDARSCWPAVRWAAAEACRCGRELVVARPVNPGIAVGYPEAAVTVAGAGDRLRWHLDHLVAGVASEHPGLPVSGILLEPAPAALTKLATAVQAAVLVVGPGRQRSTARWRTRCPVVVVNGSGRRPGAPRPVVVGAGGAGTCGPALRFAFDFARRHTTSVRIVHAWPRRTQPAFGPDCPPELVSPLVTELADVLTGFPSVPFELVPRRGRPARVLLGCVSDAALLVVGRSPAPRRRTRHWTRSLTRRAVCPVALVPACSPEEK